VGILSRKACRATHGPTGFTHGAQFRALAVTAATFSRGWKKISRKFTNKLRDLEKSWQFPQNFFGWCFSSGRMNTTHNKFQTPIELHRKLGNKYQVEIHERMMQKKMVIA
jgi:hypothetical protein